MNDFLTEEDTKQRFITPALKAAGWSANQLLMEYDLRSDRFRIVPDQNRTVKENTRAKADYLLCYGVNIPIAVLEAKRKGILDSEGLDQAITYAKKLDLPFAYSSSGNRFVEFNLRSGKQREIPLKNFPTPEELWKRWCNIRDVHPKDKKKLESAPYYTTMEGKTPRYYQMVAINKVVDAIIADHRKRLLLVMATGTGKTFTAFQIVWRLRKAGIVGNVLYLADRNQLVDQTMVGDFTPLSKIQTKIRTQKNSDGSVKKIDQNYSIYFGLYQQLKGNDEEDSDANISDYYKEVPSNYFDLIIVDECHRGSANEQSNWRKILEYFKPAIQIGLTATPNEQSGSNNRDYFGKPIFTYTLKQGIDDGFLAPFQVVTVHLDKDETGWEPQEGEKDENGALIPKRLYTLKDFGRTIELKNRTDKVAEMVTAYLQHIGPMSKTIIFCTTQHHALSMRDAMRRHNVEMCKKNPSYIVRMTADDQDGKKLYENFTSVKEEYPVVVTTSKLLSTGADTKCVKLIVLDADIQSTTEFKQIIGRGTRLFEDAGKTFFTILDFRGACEHFKDPDFNGNPDDISEWGTGDPTTKTRKGKTGEKKIPPGPPPTRRPPPKPSQVYVVGSVEVTIIGRMIQYYDENGKLVTEKFEDYTRRNILAAFHSEAKFIELWNGPKEKKAILEQLLSKGIIIEQLKKDIGNPDLDEFDLICSIAFGRTPMTRELRASKVRRSKFLEKYQGTCRAVLETLLDIYARTSVVNIDDRSVLKGESFKVFGGPQKIVSQFGGKHEFLSAVRELERTLYVPEMDSTHRNMGATRL